MAYDLNQITVGGRLTAPPELRFSQNGVAMLKFGLANQAGNKESPTSFYNVTVFRDQAERLNDMMFKGQKVVVVGRHINRPYESDGSKRYANDLEAQNVYLYSFQDDQQGGGGSAEAEDSLPF